MGFRIVGEFVEPTQVSQPLVDRNSLIEALLPAVRQVESSGGVNLLGPVLKNGDRAKGPYQFLDSTAADVASQLGMTEYNVFDEGDSKKLAGHYLGTLYDRYQDPELALAAYNYGMGNVDKRLKTAKERSFQAIAETLPTETKNYVPKVMGLIGDALVPSVQAEEPSQVAKPKYRIVGEEMPTPKYRIVGEEVPVEAPQPQSWGDYGMDIARQLGQGATFNFGDEIGLIDKAKADQFERDHPYQSMVAQGVGGLSGPLIAALMAPVAPVAGAGALAAGAGRVALGAGFKKVAPTIVGRIGQGIAAGAVPSAISGAGDAKEGERTAGAISGGLFGGLLGGAIGTGSEVVRSQVGKLPAEMKSLARRLTGYGDDELLRATKELAEAKADKSPTFLVEALDKPEFTAQAKAIARKDNTADIARNALKERQAGQYDRISDIADVISPVRSADEATSMVVGKAKAVQEGLKKAREEATTPLYSQAYKDNPTLDSQEVAELLQLPRVQKSVKKVQLDAPDMPANSTQLMDEVLADLKETAGALKASGAPRASRRVMGTASKLEGELEKILPLKQARETFAEMSVPINKLKKAGFDKILKDEYGETVAKEGFTASQLGQKLLSERTKIADVRKLKEAFGRDDEPIKAAVRSHIQDLFDRKIEGYDISNVLNTPKFKKKLNVLIGEEDAGKLLKKLDREIKISQTNKALRVGSDTAGNLEGAVNEDMRRMNWVQALGEHPKKKLGRMISAVGGAIKTPKPEVFQDEARIIFSRDPAQEALNQILNKRKAVSSYDNYGRELVRQPLLNSLYRALYGGTTMDGE